MFDELDFTVRAAVHNLLLVLYNQGITQIHTGGLMRLLGIADEIARQYDDERIVMDNEVVRYIETFNLPKAPDQLIH